MKKLCIALTLALANTAIASEICVYVEESESHRIEHFTKQAAEKGIDAEYRTNMDDCKSDAMAFKLSINELPAHALAQKYCRKGTIVATKSMLSCQS
ncbi:hypothetical protein [Aliagarivorans taiwanensis]|uniref:hypothetical protein n=1 Tax=Aliagarivorans taiwanensis TaxID=561966 RepID=UPI00040A2FD8|nr:hypothetical protein [Aliagarivorans taiwanensis]